MFEIHQRREEKKKKYIQHLYRYRCIVCSLLFLAFFEKNSIPSSLYYYYYYSRELCLLDILTKETKKKNRQKLQMMAKKRVASPAASGERAARQFLYIYNADPCRACQVEPRSTWETRFSILFFFSFLHSIQALEYNITPRL